MIPLDEAQQHILSTLRPLGSETISLLAAEGRIAAGDVAAPIDLPAFDNSAMDGYAVRAEDVAAARADRPVALQWIGTLAAGEVFPGEVGRGTCVRLFTGSPLPRGADTVVMQEDTRPDPQQPDRICFLDAAKVWENIRLRGQDVKRGATLVRRGDRLNVGRLSVLAATGLVEISAGRQPSAAVLATGSELCDPGETRGPGKIYESNRVALAGLLRHAGATPRIYPLVKDTLADTRKALDQAFLECDVVVTSGGVSVGEFDFVKRAFEDLGGQMEFWKVAIKPGKPFVFGRWREKMLFGLPGNPVSAVVTFLLLVRPAIAWLQGATDLEMPAHPGCLTERLANPGDRRHFMRVVIDADGSVRAPGLQASHAIGSLAECNGLVDVPPKTTLGAGTMVRVIGWDS
jgi:molybdopterin molybdotransferase